MAAVTSDLPPTARDELAALRVCLVELRGAADQVQAATRRPRSPAKIDATLGQIDTASQFQRAQSDAAIRRVDRLLGAGTVEVSER